MLWHVTQQIATLPTQMVALKMTKGAEKGFYLFVKIAFVFMQWFNKCGNNIHTKIT